MRRKIAFCMVIILILSSGCIGWADNKPSISSSGEPVSKELPIIPTVQENVSDESVPSTSQKSIEQELQVDPIEPEDPLLPPEEPPLEPNDKMRLLVWPGKIDLSSLSANEYFSKNITISNPNALNTNVVITFKSKENINNISVSPANLIIAANGSSNITISGITPSPNNFKAELEISNSLNSYNETCLIYATGSQVGPENQMPLSITPSQIDLSSISPNESFQNNISIYNPNESSAKITLMFKNKENFDVITVDKKSLTIPSSTTMTVKVSGIVPTEANYKAELEIANNLNDSISTCLIHGSSSGMASRPKNVKVTYDSGSKDYTITWDPMEGDIDHYNIYVKNNNKWDLWVEVIEPIYVRHFIALEVAEDLRIMITGVDPQGNNTNGTEAWWNGFDGCVNPPRNCTADYDFSKNRHIIRFDEATGLSPDYEYVYTITANTAPQHKRYETANGYRAIDDLPIDTIFTIRTRKYKKGDYWNPVFSEGVECRCIPSVSNIYYKWDSEKQDVSLFWDEPPVSYVKKYNIYYYDISGPYKFESTVTGKNYKKHLTYNNPYNYRFKIVSVDDLEHEGASTEFRTDYDSDDLAQPKSISSHINIHDNTANISWSKIPGAESYKVYVSLNGDNYYSVGTVTGKTEYVLSSPPPYDPPKDINVKIKVKATNVYAVSQKDVIETIIFTSDPIHPGHP